MRWYIINMTKKNMEVVMDKDLKCWIELHNTFPLNKILKKEIKLPLDDKGAEYIFNKLNPFVKEETNNRVKVKQVEFREHGKNSAIYSE